MPAPTNSLTRVDEDTDIWIMDSDDVWTKVPEGVDPDSPILCAPTSLPKRIAIEVEADVEAAVVQAPTCPIVEENPHCSDDDDE